MPTLVLKVDVDTLRGTREGVPRLVALLGRHRIQATFLFSLGPDHTGRAIRRVFRPGFFRKVQRTSVLSHYGLRTLLYGTLLPGPDIGLRCAEELRRTRQAGHETGIHTWDHVLWQDRVRGASAPWTSRQMQLAFERYRAIFGIAPVTHGAAGWQMNSHALRQLDTWGMAYASDGRAAGAARAPYRVLLERRTLRCVQIPTTLPTLDELVGIDGMSGAAAAQRLLEETGAAPRAHVFTLHAELEGGRLLPEFETLLSGWRAQGYDFVTLGDYYRTLDAPQLPARPFLYGSVPGRSGELMLAAAGEAAAAGPP